MEKKSVKNNCNKALAGKNRGSHSHNMKDLLEIYWLGK